MSVINRNPNKHIRRSGKGLINSKSNFRSNLSKSKRNIETTGEGVFLLPRRDKLGRVINKKFEAINSDDVINVRIMRRK